MIAVFFAALLGLVSLASDAAMAEAALQDGGAAAQEQSPVCSGNISFELNGTTYTMPRTRSMTYHKMDGTLVKSTDPAGPVLNCASSRIGPVSGFSTGFVHLGGYDIQLRHKGGGHIPQPPITSYQEAKTHIDEGFKTRKFEQLPDGTRTFRAGQTDIYLLPRTIAPTDAPNNEPAVVICRIDKNTAAIRAEQDKRSSMSSKSRALYGRRIKDNEKVKVPNVCNARYLYNGVSFGYAYYEYEPGDHLALDIYVRKQLKKLKATPAPTR